MKAIIWIIVLILVVWGIWHWVKKSPSYNNTANVSGVEYGNGTSTESTPSGSGSGTSTSEYNSKG